MHRAARNNHAKIIELLKNSGATTVDAKDVVSYRNNIVCLSVITVYTYYCICM